MTTILKLSRRDVLKATGAVGGVFALGVCLPGCQSRPGLTAATESFAPNLFVTFSPDGDVIITVSRSEMGQGVRTSLPRIVADQLEADIARVTIVQAPGDPKYGDQNTDGSKSVRMMFPPLCEAGATARVMLEQAAADHWGVDRTEVAANNHGVEHKVSGERLEFSELIEAASRLEIPLNARLKDPSEYRYIGMSAANVDREAFVTGKAVYGFDVVIPGMKYACVARAPVFDARIKSYNTDAAAKVAGVSAFCKIPFSPHTREFFPEEGIAVIADSSWAAMRGRDALEVEWDVSANGDYNTADYRKLLTNSVRNPGTAHVSRGDVDKAMAGAGKLVEALYETPMLAHAPMEPPVATAWVKENGDCEVWVPAQDPKDTRRLIAEWLDIDQSRVTVNVTFLGGAFGRKAQSDFIFEAVEASRQAGVPVKLLWTREDDIRNCYFHAESIQTMQARLGADGLPTAWLMRSAYPSIDWMWQPGLDEPMPWEVGMGLTNMPFDVPNVSIEGCKARIPIRIGWLRSVCNVWHSFAINGFVDEMAEAAGADVVAYRLRLLGKDRVFDAPNEPQDSIECFNGRWVDTGRYRRVLEFLAGRCDWGKELPENHFRGLAVQNSFYSYTATIIEIAINKDGSFSIVSVDTAVDCGRIVNPEGVTAQVEGATIFGLGLALYGELTASDGRVQQSNFHDYRVMRINETPGVIRAHLMESDEPPSGIGEPPTPVIAPALAAALYAATGTRFRRMPFMKEWSALKNS